MVSGFVASDDPGAPPDALEICFHFTSLPGSLPAPLPVPLPDALPAGRAGRASGKPGAPALALHSELKNIDETRGITNPKLSYTAPSHTSLPGAPAHSNDTAPPLPNMAKIIKKTANPGACNSPFTKACRLAPHRACSWCSNRSFRFFRLILGLGERQLLQRGHVRPAGQFRIRGSPARHESNAAALRAALHYARFVTETFVWLTPALFLNLSLRFLGVAWVGGLHRSVISMNA